jgi:hypothetical protein
MRQYEAMQGDDYDAAVQIANEIPDVTRRANKSRDQMFEQCSF